MFEYHGVGLAAPQIHEGVRLFVATLGYSRRTYVEMFLHERQSAWLQGLEGAFRHFGGVPARTVGRGGYMASGV